MKNMIRCTLCGDVLISYHRHDFKTCSCKTCFVDGGNDYQRVGYNKPEDVDVWDNKNQLWTNNKDILEKT